MTMAMCVCRAYADGDAFLLLVDSSGEASVGTVLALVVFLKATAGGAAAAAGDLDVIFLANIGTADASGSADTTNFDLIS